MGGKVAVQEMGEDPVAQRPGSYYARSDCFCFRGASPTAMARSGCRASSLQYARANLWRARLEAFFSFRIACKSCAAGLFRNRPAHSRRQP